MATEQHEQHGHPDVKGRCPACGSSSLFLGSGGYVTCRIYNCSDPGAAADMLLNSGRLAVTEKALSERNSRLGLIERLSQGKPVTFPDPTPSLPPVEIKDGFGV